MLDKLQFWWFGSLACLSKLIDLLDFWWLWKDTFWRNYEAAAMTSKEKKA